MLTILLDQLHIFVNILEFILTPIFQSRSVTQQVNQGRLPVTLSYIKMLPRLVPGYARLHKNVTKVGFRLRSVTQKGEQDCLTPTAWELNKF